MLDSVYIYWKSENCDIRSISIAKLNWLKEELNDSTNFILWSIWCKKWSLIFQFVHSSILRAALFSCFLFYRKGPSDLDGHNQFDRKYLIVFLRYYVARTIDVPTLDRSNIIRSIQDLQCCQKGWTKNSQISEKSNHKMSTEPLL